MTFQQEEAIVGIVAVLICVVLPLGYFIWRIISWHQPESHYIDPLLRMAR